jgi:predicted glycoside hydrolase/deacetylase ChbG (UPF0249 family)
MTRQIRLCADDFALNAATTDGILDLLTAGCLSATSCLVESPLWPEAAKAARDAAIPNSAMGLHFNLTEGLVESDLPLKKLLLRSLLGRVDSQFIADRLHLQLDRFERHWGQAPAHVDGHQHVHVFPGIREAFLVTLRQRYGNTLPRLRNISPITGPSDSPWKRRLLNLLGTRFGQQATDMGFSVNTGFAGVYSLSGKADYPRLFATWLHQLSDGGEILCHPAKGQSDSHGEARQTEHDFFSSNNFDDLLHCMSVKIQPLQAIR